MVNGDSSAVLRHVRALFGAGAAGGMSDGQLLERFRRRGGDPDAEAAFAVLVARHGPMVFGVCRRALRDPNDAADAFQATFLILVRKAGSVRVDDSLGRWLYGVSRRVAARARTAKKTAPATPVMVLDCLVAIQRRGFSAACRRASSPTRRSPLSVNATTLGVRRWPSWLAMTFTSLPSITDTTELVVPRSIPMIFSPSAMFMLPFPAATTHGLQTAGMNIVMS